MLQVLAVMAGGAFGALCRYGLSEWMAAAFAARFNFATLVANVAGSLLMGVCYVLIVEKMLVAPLMRQLVMVGFLGAFTTFSTFSLETLALLHGGQILAAVGYMLASVVLCVVAVSIGFAVTQAIVS